MAIAIRTARIDELAELEALQLRASLANPGDREAVLAHPDAIMIPPSQIADGQVFVAESDGSLLGFSAVLDPFVCLNGGVASAGRVLGSRPN